MFLGSDVPLIVIYSFICTDWSDSGRGGWNEGGPGNGRRYIYRSGLASCPSIISFLC